MAKQKDQWEKHHRKPNCFYRKKEEADDPKNISMVNPRKHKAWHILFGDMDAHAIVRELNSKWMDNDFQVKLVPKFPSTQLQIFYEQNPIENELLNS